MIGNRYLRQLFEYEDEDTNINQLLELLKLKDVKMVTLIYMVLKEFKCNIKALDY